MTTATVQFQTVEQWQGGTAAGLPNAIDADDDTAATVSQPLVDNVESIRLADPVVPVDLVFLDTLQLRVVRQYASSAGKGEDNVARIYSREADGAPWSLRYDGTVGHLAKQTDLVSVPVTSLADLQILVESYNTPEGGGTPEDPEVAVL